MFQILIVDDEPTALEAVRLLLADELDDNTRTFTAQSAEQAMKYFPRWDIDLLIADIEMSGMSGLDLLQWVHENYPKTQMIILTCHAEFAYAQKALAVGTLEYILKPPKGSELKAAIQRAANIRAGQTEAADRREELLRIHTTSFLHDVLDHTLPSNPTRLDERAEQLGIADRLTGVWLPILLHTERWYDGVSKDDARLFSYGLQNSAAELLLEDQNSGYMLPISSEEAVLLRHAKNGDTGENTFLAGNCHELISLGNNYLRLDLSCYIGRAVPIQELAAQLDYIQAFRIAHPARHNQVYSVWEDSDSSSCQKIELAQYNWEEILLAGKEDEAVRAMMKQLEAQVTGNNGAMLLRRFQQDFLQSLYTVLYRNNLQANRLFEDSHSFELSDRSLNSLEYFEEWLRWILSRSGLMLRRMREDRTIIADTKEYIATHIGDDLSRNTISDAMYISPEYLSRLFHRETGITLRDYITHQRIATAKHLLIGTKMRVADISLAVGYANPSSFSKVFHDLTNMTPAEYRKTHL